MTTAIDPAPEARKSQSVRERLSGEHVRVDHLLARLQEQAAADVRPELERTWGEVERVLLAHFEDEETFLFPRLAEVDPAEHQALARDHADIRALLGELGVAIEVHAVRASTLDALAAKLRDHAKREDAAMYRWAETSGATGIGALVKRLIHRAGGEVGASA